MNKMPQEDIGKYYMVAFGFCVVGLFLEWSLFMIIGAVLMIYTFWSDDDPNNHIDPDGMGYMDRNGYPVSGGEHDKL